MVDDDLRARVFALLGLLLGLRLLRSLGLFRGLLRGDLLLGRLGARLLAVHVREHAIEVVHALAVAQVAGAKAVDLDRLDVYLVRHQRADGNVDHDRGYGERLVLLVAFGVLETALAQEDASAERVHRKLLELELAAGQLRHGAVRDVLSQRPEPERRGNHQEHHKCNDNPDDPREDLEHLAQDAPLRLFLRLLRRSFLLFFRHTSLLPFNF